MSQLQDVAFYKIIENTLSCFLFNRNEYELGSGDHLIVSWDIQSEVSANDWIGLFHAGRIFISLGATLCSRLSYSVYTCFVIRCLNIAIYVVHDRNYIHY